MCQIVHELLPCFQNEESCWNFYVLDAIATHSKELVRIAISVVVDDSTHRPQLFSDANLVDKHAAASLHQHDFALDLVGVIDGVACLGWIGVEEARFSQIKLFVEVRAECARACKYNVAHTSLFWIPYAPGCALS